MANDINNIVTINEKGVSKLDFAEIVNVLVERYRKIYGYDIDIDPRTGDGRFLYDIANVMNTGAELIVQLYNQLNPAIASGYFLDILCSLTNVSRRSATRSQALVKISSSSANDVKVSLSALSLTDESGNLWSVASIGSDSVTIPSNGYVELIYQSEQVGSVSASSFVFTDSSMGSFLTLTCESIELGRKEETDSELRYRRADTANYGITILQGMQGALRRVIGVEDTKVFNNSDSFDKTIVVNGTTQTIKPYSIYVVLKSSSVNPPDRASVANVIRSYLTAGIKTSGDITKAGVQYYDTISSANVIERTIWQNILSSSPSIKIELNVASGFGGQNTADLIKNEICEYFNSRAIFEPVSQTDMLQCVQSVDPLYNSRSTYFVRKVTVGGNTDLENDSDYNGYFFEYNPSLMKATISGTGNMRTITIEKK